MSDCYSTRSRFYSDNPHYREHAAAAVAIARTGVAPTLDQSVALERICVRMHGRANRHELGAWREDPDVDAGEIVACVRCGRRAFLSRQTGQATIAELVEACK